MYQHVLVATDGSPRSLHAVDIAGRIAAEMGAAVTVVHVREPSEDEPAAIAIIEQARDVLASRGLDAKACVMRPVGVTNLGRRILEAQQTHEADLVVVGARGSGGRGRSMLIGSVSSWLVEHTPVSVLVVR